MYTLRQKNQQREKSDKNNSVTDTKRRMLGSPTLRQDTSWLSNGEEQSKRIAYHSVSGRKHKERKMPIDWHRVIYSGWGTAKVKGKDWKCSAKR